MSEKSKKKIIFFTKVSLILLTAVYPFFMVIMTGTGLVCNYAGYGKEVMYNGIFLIFSGILMTTGSICCMFRKKILNIISVIMWITGIVVCMIMLYKLCVHADNSGWCRNLSPVSNMYKSRIFPVIIPCFINFVISGIHIHAE